MDGNPEKAFPLPQTILSSQAFQPIATVHELFANQISKGYPMSIRISLKDSPLIKPVGCKETGVKSSSLRQLFFGLNALIGSLFPYGAALVAAATRARKNINQRTGDRRVGTIDMASFFTITAPLKTKADLEWKDNFSVKLQLKIIK